jgi:hypothetical protein
MSKASEAPFVAHFSEESKVVLADVISIVDGSYQTVVSDNIPPAPSMDAQETPLLPPEWNLNVVHPFQAAKPFATASVPPE